MSKKARTYKSLQRSLNRLAKIVVKIFELPSKNPCDFLNDNYNIVLDNKHEYKWKIK